jgi:hypothetical protein
MPSSHKTLSLAVSLMSCGVLPIMLIESFASLYVRLLSYEDKLKYIGGFLLVLGLVVQFVAAVMDLNV